MLPKIVLHVTPRTVRVEVTGTGVVLEEAAAIVLQYHARSGPLVLAVGDDARGIETKGFDPIALAKAQDDPDVFARIVPREAAPWWKVDTTPAPERAFDPWDHNGECVVVWPFTPEMFSPALGDAMVRYFRFAALYRKSTPRVGAPTRWWLTLFSFTEVRLSTPPPTEAARDALLRALARYRLRLAGAPDRPAPRPLSELSWQQWASAALVAIGLPALMWARTDPARVHSPLTYALVLVGAPAVLAGMLITTFRAAGPDDELSRETLARSSAAWNALRRFETIEPEGDPSAGTFRLGAQGVAQIVPLLCAFGLLGLVGLVARILGWDRLSGPQALAMFLAVLVSFVAGGVLGELLVGARIVIGARGISVRRLGLASRPLFIPLTQIRSAVAVLPHRHARQPAALSIVLRDGDELRFAVSPALRFWRGQKVALAAEEALLATLGIPRPYRKPLTPS